MIEVQEPCRGFAKQTSDGKQESSRSVSPNSYWLVCSGRQPQRTQAGRPPHSYAVRLEIQPYYPCGIRRRKSPCRALSSRLVVSDCELFTVTSKIPGDRDLDEFVLRSEANIFLSKNRVNSQTKEEVHTFPSQHSLAENRLWGGTSGSHGILPDWRTQHLPPRQDPRFARPLVFLRITAVTDQSGRAEPLP